MIPWHWQERKNIQRRNVAIKCLPTFTLSWIITNIYWFRTTSNDEVSLCYSRFLDPYSRLTAYRACACWTDRGIFVRIWPQFQDRWNIKVPWPPEICFYWEILWDFSYSSSYRHANPFRSYCSGWSTSKYERKHAMEHMSYPGRKNFINLLKSELTDQSILISVYRSNLQLSSPLCVEICE